ncbi:hypothetical protein M405DRAFT_805275 [Rhizopogon salebrosus TDB-379]|nr:hypothetical protein M405DRAFT_805275 [Rhizopogon salebrosus TDB-379]
MATQSLEQQKKHYSHELAAYTFRQWTAVRRSVDTQKSDASLSSAMRNVSLASPGPPAVQDKKSTRHASAEPGQQTEKYWPSQQ